jgi:hypothetical protein
MDEYPASNTNNRQQNAITAIRQARYVCRNKSAGNTGNLFALWLALAAESVSKHRIMEVAKKLKNVLQGYSLRRIPVN